MTAEIIAEIRRAEQKADAIRRDAAADAKTITDDAENEAYRIAVRYREEAETEYKALVEMGKMSAEPKCAEAARETEAVCAKLAAQADKNMDKAVDIIIGKVVGAQ